MNNKNTKQVTIITSFVKTKRAMKSFSWLFLEGFIASANYDFPITTW
jgi:hypothetical protein